MVHTNTIAIKILKKQYSDYPENAWHYDDQYKMMVQAMEEATDLLAVKQETEIELSKEEIIILEIWNYCCQYNVCCNAVHPSIIKTLAGKIKAYGEFVRDSAAVSEAGEQEKALKEAREALDWCMHNMKPDSPDLQSDAFNIPANAIVSIDTVLLLNK